MQIAKRVLTLVLIMRRDPETDRFADIPRKLKEDYQRNILGIEPPTVAERIRNFWHRYEVFFHIGTVAFGAGIGGALLWQMSESEEVRIFFTRAVMVGTGIGVGAFLFGTTGFIGSNIIVDVLTERFRKKP